MPVGFNSPARNLFLLGSSGTQVVSNFFESISKASTTDGGFIPDEIRYIDSSKKYALAGSAQDSNTKEFGWFERQDYDLDTGNLTTDYSVRIESTDSANTSDTSLRAMELDSNENLIVVGKTINKPWIAKYSNAGVLDWQSTTNSADVEYTGITSDSSGNYYACGSTPTSGSAQAFVEKFDSNGNPGWGKSAFMLGRDVVLEKISANSGGHVVAVGYLEDDSAEKGYIVKIDTTTGEVLWDRTLERNISGFGEGNPSGGGSDDITPAEVRCTACYIDSRDQIYVVGTIDGNPPVDNGVGEFLIKYSAEGNIIWQRERGTRDFTASDGAPNIVPFDVKSDGETEQTVVLSVNDYGPFALDDSDIFLSKYSRNGDLVFRRRISKGSQAKNLGAACLDADPSFYYIMFRDQKVDIGAGEPDRYTFGKVSTSGNGFGAFQYDDGQDIIDYTVVSNAENKIGRLSDGSVTNSVSDLMTYPFTANQVVFDDLATHVSNKKRQMDDADSFEYSGSPAIRIFDFQQELNLLGDTGITEAVDTTPTIGTIVFGFDNADNSFDATNDGSLVLDTTGYTFNTWSGSQLMSGLGGFGANSAQVWRTNNYDSVLWTISTDTTDRYIYTSDDGINWIQSTDLYDTDADPVNVTSKWLATSAGANVSTITVSGAPGGTNYTNRWDATVNYNHGGTYAFDGSESTRVEPKDNQTVTWTAGTAIPVSSTLEFNIVRAGTIAAGDFQVNGTNYGGSVPSTQGWITIPESSLSSFSLFHNSGTSSVEVFAVRIDGSILTDGDDVPTGTSTPGAWVDQSGKGNSGTVNGATHNAARYWEFDGVDDEIDFGNQASIITSGSFTVEAWAWRDTITAENGLFDIEDTNQGVILLSAGNNGGNDYRFLVRKGTFGAGPIQVNVEASIAGHGLNEWHHYLGTYDDDTGTIVMYVDGVQVDTDTNASVKGVNFSGTLDSGIHIGPSAGRGRWHDGRVGEVRVYPRALTAAQVFQNYNATKSKYINEAPDTAPKIGPGIVYDSNLLLNYDFGNRATYDNVNNLLPYSADIRNSQTNWDRIGVDIVSTDLKGPFGERGVVGLVEQTNNGQHTLYDDIPYVYNEGMYTSSCWIKPGTRSYAEVFVNGTGDSGTSTSAVRFNFNDGTWIDVGPIAPNAVAFEEGPNGWWFCGLRSVIETTAIPGNPGEYRFHVRPATASTGDYQGDDSAPAIYIFQPQVSEDSNLPRPPSSQLSQTIRYVPTYNGAIQSTTVKNLSTGSADGTINGAEFDTDGYFVFDGTNDRIQIDPVVSLSTTSGFTVCAWLKMTGLQSSSTWNYFIKDADGSNPVFETGIYNTNNYSFAFKDNSVPLQISTVLTQNQWHLICFGVNSSAGLPFIYRDGIYAGGSSTAFGSGNFPIAHIMGPGGNNLAGQCGEVQAYNRELSGAEVLAHFNATRGKYGV